MLLPALHSLFDGLAHPGNIPPAHTPKQRFSRCHLIRCGTIHINLFPLDLRLRSRDSIGGSTLESERFVKRQWQGCEKTKPMQVINLPEGSAATVFLGLAFISLSSNIAISEERLRQMREMARKRKHKEGASGARCSTFVRIAAFAK